MRWLIMLYPWLELLSLIQLGVETNALVALGWVMMAMFLGGLMLRWVGFASVMRLREAQMTGVLRQRALLDEMAVAIAALLLIVPGLLSDLLAVIVLVGPLRRGLMRWLGFDQGGPPTGGGHGPGRHGPVTLEGDYTRVDEDSR